MNPTLRSVAVDLAELAEQRHVSSAACLARRVAEEPRLPRYAVLALLDADASSLADWIEATAPGTALTVVREDSAHAALDLWMADRVLVAFPCGGLPTSSTLAALASGPLQRQPRSAAVVLIGAEEIETADDLALVESTARRWLLAPDASGEPPADVQAAGAYLWSQRTGAASPFAPRLTRDRDALVRWLQTPLSPETLRHLDEARLRFALAFLEDALHESAQRGASERIDRRTIYRLQDDLANLKGRLLSRLRSDSEQLEMAAQQAVDDLDHTLSDGLRGALEEMPISRNWPEAALSQRIGHYCDDGVRVWLGKQQRVSEQWRQALTGLCELLEQQDWAALAAATGKTDYPECLLTALSEGNGSDWRMDLACGEVGASEEAASLPASSRSLRRSLTALGTGVLGVAAAAVSGCGPFGMAVVGAATSTAAAGYQWHASRGDVRTAAEAYGRQVIGELVARLRRQVPDGVSNLAGTLRLRLVAELDRLQEVLDGLLRSQAPNSEPEFEGALRDIRDRLDRLVTHDAVPGR